MISIITLLIISLPMPTETRILAMASNNPTNQAASNAIALAPPGPPARTAAVPFPSNTGIVSRGNEDLCRIVLDHVERQQLHVPPNKLGAVANFLWNAQGTGPLDGQYKRWTVGREFRNMRERVTAILNHHSNWDPVTTPYPSTLQVLAKRLNDEFIDAQQEQIQRRNTEHRQVQERQATNNHAEGSLGFLPPGRGTGVPTLGAANEARRNRAINAASLLARNPRSQNNPSEICYDVCF